MKDYADETKAIGGLVKLVASGARRLAWNLARNTPDAIRRTAEAHNETLKAANESYRRNRSDHARVIAEMIGEETAARRLAASTARFHLEPHVPKLEQQYRAFVARCRGDVGLSMPDALNHLSPTAMLTYHLLAETLRPAIANASAADLLRRYERAMETQDARGDIEARLIEERAEGGGLATTEQDLPIIKHLNEFIASIQDLRVPFSSIETTEILSTIDFGKKQIGLAELTRVHPVNADHPANVAAKLAYEAEADAYSEAIEAAAAAAGE